MESDATERPLKDQPPDASSLDPRALEWIRNNSGPNNFGERDENGIDLSLIRSALALSPAERLRRVDRMVLQFKVILKLRDNARLNQQPAGQLNP